MIKFPYVMVDSTDKLFIDMVHQNQVVILSWISLHKKVMTVIVGDGHSICVGQVDSSHKLFAESAEFMITISA